MIGLGEKQKYCILEQLGMEKEFPRFQKNILSPVF